MFLEWTLTKTIVYLGIYYWKLRGKTVIESQSFMYYLPASTHPCDRERETLKSHLTLPVAHISICYRLCQRWVAGRDGNETVYLRLGLEPSGILTHMVGSQTQPKPYLGLEPVWNFNPRAWNSNPAKTHSLHNITKPKARSHRPGFRT